MKCLTVLSQLGDLQYKISEDSREDLKKQQITGEHSRATEIVTLVSSIILVLHFIISNPGLIDTRW